MAVAFRDYYEVLGVPRDASAADIKKAFRKLAHRFHPDVAKDKSTADVRFKELNEANEVLSDPEKRRKYDALGEHWDDREPPAPSPRGGGFGDDDGAAEFHFEGTGFSDFFERYFGSRSRPGAGFGPDPGRGDGGARFATRGADIDGDLVVTLDEVVHGATRTITLQRGDPRGGTAPVETLRVKIPAGVHEAQRIRLAGKGHPGVRGGAPGDLFLRLTFATHPDFRVRGTDLYYDLDLAPWEAVLGAAITIPTLDGPVSLKVPPGASADTPLRLKGRGLPTADGNRGHLYAVPAIQVPARSTPEEIHLWEQLAKRSTFHPRNPS